MGALCLGRVGARMCLSPPPPFSSCFVKLMNDNRASENSLPTPDSHSHPAHPHHQRYTPFLLSSSQDMHHHLPPLHHFLPHSHHPQTHSHSHSLPKGLDTQAVNVMPFPLRSSTLPKSSSASPAPAAFLCLPSFRSTRGGTRTRGWWSTSTTTTTRTTSGSG